MSLTPTPHISSTSAMPAAPQPHLSAVSVEPPPRFAPSSLPSQPPRPVSAPPSCSGATATPSAIYQSYHPPIKLTLKMTRVPAQDLLLDCFQSELVQRSQKEFKRNLPRPRQRGRPPKPRLWQLGTRTNVTVPPKPAFVKYNPTQEEVETYLRELEQEGGVENGAAAGPRKRGRPRITKPEIETTIIPRKRGRPPKPLTEADFLPKIPKKLGRPPKPRNPDMIPEIKRKPGRPPKPKTEADLIPKVLKKRGRPPKPKTEEDLKPKLPKRRGRPPKPRTLEDMLPKAPEKNTNLPEGDLLAIEEAGQLKLEKTNSCKKKSKWIFTFEQDGAAPTMNPEEILRMYSAGVPVKSVILSPPETTGVKRRGRPPKSGPKLPKIPRLRMKLPKKQVPTSSSSGEPVEPQVPKKRGPKPKPKLDLPKPPPKKRGPKPKPKPDLPKPPPRKRGPKPKPKPPPPPSPPTSILTPDGYRIPLPGANRKVGRPKKGFEREKLKVKPPPKPRGRKRLNPEERMKRLEAKKAPEKVEKHKAVAHQVSREHNPKINNPNKVAVVLQKFQEEHPVPAYRPRHVMSCRFCQQWSWDLSRCSNCLRAPLPPEKFLLVEEHEALTDSVDKSRPVFRLPPVPMFCPGEVFVCPFCFYCTPVTEKNCVECEEEMPPNSLKLNVEFLNNARKKNLPCLRDLNIFYLKLKLRKMTGSDLAQCPGCGLTFSRAIRPRRCPHCKLNIPKEIKVTVVDHSVTEAEINMLARGMVQLPDVYVPLYREGCVTQCRWCCTWVCDLNRCRKCCRKLPRSSELINNPSMITERGGEAPQYEPEPELFPRPGLMGLCPECHRYSRQLRQCEHCDKRLLLRDMVHLEFAEESSKPTASMNGSLDPVTGQNDDILRPLTSHPEYHRETTGSKLIPYEPRKVVGITLYVCPMCEFTTASREMCTSCFRTIPCLVRQSNVGSTVPGRRPPVDVVPRAPPKLRSIFMASTLGHLMAINTIPTKTKLKKYRLPTNYVPRYRELGAAQCPGCLAWTFDMAYCGSCQAPLLLDPRCPPPLIFSKAPFKDPVVEMQRPIFARRPVPYLRPGRVTLCFGCHGYTTGGTFCTLCGKLVVSHPQFVNIDFTYVLGSPPPPNSFTLPYTPRLTLDEKLALCPHCGFTTENFQKCSYCKIAIPKNVVIVPEDPTKHSFVPLMECLRGTQNKASAKAIILKAVPPPTDSTKKIVKIATPLIKKVPVRAAQDTQQPVEDSTMVNIPVGRYENSSDPVLSILSQMPHLSVTKVQPQEPPQCVNVDPTKEQTFPEILPDLFKPLLSLPDFYVNSPEFHSYADPQTQSWGFSGQDLGDTTTFNVVGFMAMTPSTKNKVMTRPTAGTSNRSSSGSELNTPEGSPERDEQANKKLPTFVSTFKPA